MIKKQSRLAELWRKAANDLGLQIVTPFELNLGKEASLEVPLLVRYFGAKHGMLVVSNYEIVKNIAKQLLDAGYSFSVLSEPGPDEEYVRDDYIDVLRDWGWAGEPAGIPLWLKELR